MNMCARFDDFKILSKQSVTDGNHENSIPTTNKVCGGTLLYFFFPLVLTPITVVTKIPASATNDLPGSMISVTSSFFITSAISLTTSDGSAIYKRYYYM